MQSTDFSTNVYFLTIELAIGNIMPNVNIPSKGPAVIPDKLLPAWKESQCAHCELIGN